MVIRSAKDFWTGLIYIFFGLSAVLLATDYGMGTAIKMGPGYFPIVLGALLTLIGIIAVGRSFVGQGASAGGRLDLPVRPPRSTSWPRHSAALAGDGERPG
jgi:hypothetical protein